MSEVVELLEHLQLAASLNTFYEIPEHFLQRGVTEWSNLQNGPSMMFLVYSEFMCCCSQKVSTPYSEGVAVASSAAQLLIQSALKWYNYSCFACMAAKGKLTVTFLLY